MSAKELNTDQYTSLPVHTLDLSVVCEGLTFFTLNTIDNLAGSSSSHASWHGLGLTPDGEKLGAAGFTLYNPIADGVPARTITSQDGGATWQSSSLLSNTVLTAVAMGDTLTPIAARKLSAQIALRTHIAPASGLSLVDEVPMDGSATLQVKYL